MICNYNKLDKFVENKLSLDDQLQVLLHVEVCNRCFEEIYRQRKLEDQKYFVQKKFKLEKMAG